MSPLYPYTKKESMQYVNNIDQQTWNLTSHYTKKLAPKKLMVKPLQKKSWE